MPVAKYRTYQISKEKLASYHRSAPVNDDGVFEHEEKTNVILEPEQVNTISLKNKSKNRSKINGSLLDGSDIMSAPIISRAWKVPSNLITGNANRLRFTTVNHGYLKDCN